MGGAAAIVLAGGSGTRVGAGQNKVYLPLGGRTVLGWSLRAFVHHPGIGPVVLVVRPQDLALADRERDTLATEIGPKIGPEIGPEIGPKTGAATRDALPAARPEGRVGEACAATGVGTAGGSYPPVAARDTGGTGSAVAGLVDIVTGGGTRQESELCGLRRLAPRIASGDIDTVLVHDGARPLVSAELISAVLAAARADGGAVPGVFRNDIGEATADGAGLRLPPAADVLLAVQTPQGFRAAPLLAAYEQARRHGFVGTDTASCVQRFTDLDVRWVRSDQRNLKITYAHDLVLAEHALTRR